MYVGSIGSIGSMTEMYLNAIPALPAAAPASAPRSTACYDGVRNRNAFFYRPDTMTCNTCSDVAMKMTELRLNPVDANLDDAGFAQCQSSVNQYFTEASGATWGAYGAYVPQGWVVPSRSDFTSPSGAATGTLEDCASRCTQLGPLCRGFSRGTAPDDDASGICYMNASLDDGAMTPSEAYQTYVQQYVPHNWAAADQQDDYGSAIGSVQDCNALCNMDLDCKGYARDKKVTDEDPAGTCLFMRDLPDRRTDKTPMRTFVKSIDTSLEYDSGSWATYTDWGADLPGMPIRGTVAFCNDACSRSTECKGYVRGGGVADTDTRGECWLKRRIDMSKAVGAGAHKTFVKPQRACLIRDQTFPAAQPMEACRETCQRGREDMLAGFDAGVSRKCACKTHTSVDCALPHGYTDPSLFKWTLV